MGFVFFRLCFVSIKRGYEFVTVLLFFLSIKQNLSEVTDKMENKNTKNKRNWTAIMEWAAGEGVRKNEKENREKIKNSICDDCFILFVFVGKRSKDFA